VIKLEGDVVEFNIRNPHSFILIEVTEKDGKKVKWGGEWGGVTQLSQGGVTRFTLEVGDHLIIEGAHVVPGFVDLEPWRERILGWYSRPASGPLPRAGLPVVVVHGLDDGLVPPAFSSAPYVAAAQAAGREVRYWQVHNAEHFDAFLGFPDYAARFVPMLPYVYAALDRVDAYLDGKGALPVDAVIASTPRGSAQLTAGNLAIP